MLFISSYVPLYILLIIKNILERCTDRGQLKFSIDQLKNAHFFDEVNDYAILTLLILCFISIWYLKKLLRSEKDIHYYTVKEIEDQTGNVYFNYISVYLLSCLGLSLSNIVDVFVLFFLMFIVGYIYISNHMTYMNPVLQFLGYKVYEGKLISASTHKEIATVIISPIKVSIRIGEMYIGSGKEDFVNISNYAEGK